MHESKTRTVVDGWGVLLIVLTTVEVKGVWFVLLSSKLCSLSFPRTGSPRADAIEPSFLSLYPSIFCISSVHLVSDIDLNIVDSS